MKLDQVYLRNALGVTIKNPVVLKVPSKVTRIQSALNKSVSSIIQMEVIRAKPEKILGRVGNHPIVVSCKDVNPFFVTLLAEYFQNRFEELAVVFNRCVLWRGIHKRIAG
eukprot:CAMPEP_0184460628 /NCGR_PEP_ID=MMETSP0740-20130409/41344_1 /TAXON_ID=385413 /ORGANISM="Thalassiosira miniscula, Strain CCMP1093" /LENGTH=109 /DNA_ID=CAMNT_0026833997 /DNA_START=80 /DNA_END=405 /DNA_ORIENTATION=+